MLVAMGRVVGVVAAIVGALFVTLMVWLFFGALASGFAFGPGESVAFDSKAELLERGFVDQGARWPGSDVHLHRRAEGYLLQRQWLGMRELRVDVSDDLLLDTAGYERGPADRIQIWIAGIRTLVVAIGLGFAIWRFLIRRNLPSGRRRS